MNISGNAYSIKDLENISGIKAHTIRIWEKRYNILEPMRTDTNIRYYDFSSIQRLLNITLLHNHGYKISKISQYPSENIPRLVNEIITEKTYKSHAINAFKIAMLNFDTKAFYQTYDQFLENKSFSEIFSEIFIPLLNEIGILWQTSTITASHEHFICNLIEQKLAVASESILKKIQITQARVFFLFLPLQETHELGLKYLAYELALHGYQTIYLGRNIEIADLTNSTGQFENIVFLTYITSSPSAENTNAYIENAANTLLNPNTTSELWVTGVATENLQSNNSRVRHYLSIGHIIKSL